MTNAKRKANPRTAPAKVAKPSHAVRKDANARQTRASSGRRVLVDSNDVDAGTQPSPKKTRSCTTCKAPMKGHSKTECARTKSGPGGLDARAAAAEEAVLAAHTDLISRSIDRVVAEILEQNDGTVTVDEVAAALEQAGLVLPEGKSYQDFIPVIAGDDGDGDGDDDDTRSQLTASPPPEGCTGDAGSGGQKVSSGASDHMQVDEAPAVPPPVEVTDDTLMQQPPAPPAKKPARKRRTYALNNGWKSTRSGDLPLDLDGNGLKRVEYPTQAEKAKRTPRMFQAVAQKGDTLAARTDGYAFCVFVPRGGAGIMRTWHSARVEADVPDLLPDVRRLVFERLQPFREQYLQSIQAENKEVHAQMEHWKALAHEKDKENAELREELAAIKNMHT